VNVILRHIRFLILCLIQCYCSLLFGQEPTKNLAVRTDFHYGFVIPEYQHFNYLVNKPVVSGEISLFRQSVGRNYWEPLYKYPEAGLTLQFTTLGNKEVFGNEFGLFPYVQTPFIRREKFVFFNQFGLGVGYATKKFDLETNYENISVGSHLNVHFNFKLGSKFRLNKHLWINSGLSFTHYSNANMAEPNLGVNLFTAFAGMNYQITQVPVRIEKPIGSHQQKHEFALIYSAGGKHTRALQSAVYFTSSASVEYKHHTFRKIHFGGGIDLSYDSATETEMSIPGKSNYQRRYDYRTGVHLSQELVYDRFSFILQQGFYVGLTDQVNKSFMYNRANLRWKFNEHILMHVSMRSHLHILDYPEIGVGYYFLKTTKEKSNVR
jgi:hypothetical protein